MFCEFLTDLSIIIEKSELSEKERMALQDFSQRYSDSLSKTSGRPELEQPILKQAFRKIKEHEQYAKYCEIMKMPKSWNTDEY